MNFFGFLKNNKKKRKYEGASKGRRTSGWITGSGDANTMIRHDLAWLRERSRYLRRNNANAHKAVEVVTNNVIGKGIMTEISGAQAQRAKDLWKAWAESTACDFDGRHDLAGLQRMAMDAIQESGEVLIRRRIIDDAFPVKYQILESDFLATDRQEGLLTNGNTVIQGVEFDSLGRRVAYHLYETHPGSTTYSGLSTLKVNRISADEVYHLYRQERPGQARGVPWATPCMIKMKDLDDFEDATLMRQKIANLFVAFVSDISAEVECDDESDLGERMVPAMIEHLPPGKTVDFADPPEPQNFQEFVKVNQRSIAQAWGITYESLSGDYGNVNFSSGRMGWIEMGRNIEAWRKHLIINPFLKNAQKDFLFMGQLLGISFGDLTFDHIAPRRELIDPQKEYDAMVTAMRAGLESRSSAIRSLGKDPETVNEQIKNDNEKQDELGFIFDSDPRATNKQGQAQMQQSGE
tara:strand:- start:39420 stop:40811 length:1392 start_codon:yes stop_codon:yes gene_type:complete